MNKLYTKIAGSESKFSRFPFIKVVSVTSIAALLSSVSPVFSKNIDSIEEVSTDIKAVSVVYPQSVISVYDDSLDVSKDNYITVSNTTLAPNAHVLNDNANFLTRTFSDVGDDNSLANTLKAGGSNRLKRAVSTEEEKKQSIINPQLSIRNSMSSQQFAQYDENSVIIGVSDSSRNVSTAITNRDAGLQRADTNVTLGEGSQVQKKSSVAIGYMAHAMGTSSTALGGEYNEKSEHGENDYTTAKGDYSTALGAVSKALGYGSTAVGHRAYATEKEALSIGFYSRANTDHAVALGADSIANVAAGVAGYSPFLRGTATGDDFAWKSTYGAVSVGDIANKKTRQIGGVAAGSANTDAVNVAQLKSLQNYVDKGWKLSVDGKNAKAVGIDGTVDLAAGSSNFTITKGESDNKVTFDLAKNLTLESVKAGQNIFNGTGLIIANGPQITTEGINAGSKKITGVAEGTNETDAVNLGQLKKIGQQVAASSFVKQDADTKHITIGKDADGDRIDLINKTGGTRTLSGVKAGTAETDAVNFGQLNKTKQEVQEQIQKQVQEVEKQVAANSFVKQDDETRSITIGKDTDGERIDLINKTGGARTLSGVKAGTAETDAVNFAQLQKVEKDVKEQVAANSFVKQDDKTRSITIGKDTDGDKIDITNTSGANRIISGVEDAKNNNDAVNKGQLDKGIENVSKDITNKFNDFTQNITHITQQVQGDALLWSESDGAFVAQHGEEKAKSKIKFLANGEITEDSTDAINGSQLFATNQNVITVSNNLQTAATKIAETFGGGAEYKDGEWSAPTFTLKTVNTDGEEKDATYHNVAEALSGVGQSFTNVQNNFTKEITNQINNAITKVEGESFIQQDKETNRLTIGAKTEGTEINIANTSGANRIISGVEDAKNNNDAVNKGQLDKGIENVSKDITNKFNDFTQNITHITQQVQGDALLWSESDGAFVAQHGEEKAKSKIKFLANGEITEDSTDAINGSQLFATNQNVITVSNNLQTAATKIAETFGGGAEYKDGEWSAPTFTLKTVNTDGEEKDATYHNVAEALSGVGQSFTNVQNNFTKEITNQINNAITKVEGESFIQQDKETNRLTIGAKTEGTEINIANASGAHRIISGVEDAKNSNEAVNKGQLDKGIENVSQDITNKFNDFTQSITHITQQVQGDALLWSDADKAFVAQHGEEKAKSKLKYLLNGDITAESTDAINGSQLYSMGNNLAGYLSSGAGYDENGEWKAPTFTLKTVKEDGTADEESYDTVEKALSAVGTSFTNIQNKITNEITNEINKTKGDALLWSEADKAFVAQHGEGDKKADSKIMHLKAGDITAESTDAINGSQIYTLKNQIAGYFGGGAGYQDGEWNAPTFYVSQFKNGGNGKDKTSYDNVAAAFEGVNGSLSDINERINNVAQSVSSSGLNWNEEEKAFDARHNDQNSKITHVADGKLSEDSKEAVNGSQLFETNNRVSKVENRVDNIDQQIKNIENTVTNDAVKYDKDEKGDKINKVTFAGVSESDPVVLDNVAAGDLSKDSKQAVNGSQLWETNQKIDVVLDKAKEYTNERFNDIINHQMGDVINEAKSYTDMKFDALNYSIEGVRKEARQAAAIGIAVANLRYNETPGKLSVGFGTGLWRNKSAFAFGAGYTSESGSVLSNVSVTNSGGHWGVGAGFNMTLN